MPVLELSSVTKMWGSVRALDDVVLAVGAGELVAVLGPNGAGKSTLFDLVLGLAAPTHGIVSVFGGAPGSLATVQRTGAMLQHAGLPDNLTVRELVRLVGRSYASAFDLDEVIDQVGLAAQQSRTISRLSGGERQRALLAMALAGTPDVLLLDEPTSAMDPDAKRSFWRQMSAAVARGTTVVFATHDMTEADRIADRVVVLTDGRIVSDGAIAELKTRFGNLEDAYLALTTVRPGPVS